MIFKLTTKEAIHIIQEIGDNLGQTKAAIIRNNASEYFVEKYNGDRKIAEKIMNQFLKQLK